MKLVDKSAVTSSLAASWVKEMLPYCLVKPQLKLYRQLDLFVQPS